VEKHVIIVAGGIGKRMQTEIPKQFLNVAGRPVLIHTFECFLNYAKDIKITLVLPEPYIDFWKSLCKRFTFEIDHKVVEGGPTRFISVRKGLKEIQNGSLVAIHDGVRPLVAKETLYRVFKKAEETGNAIPAVKINESLRKINDENSFYVNRREYRLIQTPQCFHAELIKKAYKQEFEEEFTDDATVIEAMGIKINLVEGNSENIKITRAGDLKIAEAFLK
jgi:2-C-methyl-D-erythritol 4-phosphate cytidylyltransferase